MNKKILFILGMHRSGTSALAGALHISGISGGQKMMQPSFDNEKGFFENQDAFEINERILKELGLSWDSPFCLPDHWVYDSRLEKHKSAIRHFLVSSLNTQTVIYTKDPRLCYLLPVWQEVISELGFVSKILITLRHPEEIYQSLNSRNGTERNEAYALWLNHLLLAERNTRDCQRMFISYNDLLESPVRQLEKVYQTFEMGNVVQDWGGVSKKVKEFIDKKLKHQKAELTGLEKQEWPYLNSLFDYLKLLSEHPDDKDVFAKIDEIRQVFFSNQKLFTTTKKQRYFATLKIESGQNSRMITPLKIPVYEGLSEVVFSVGHISTPIEKAVIYPTNELSHVALKAIKVNYTDGSTDNLTSFEKHVILEHGNNFFLNDSGYFLIEPVANKKMEAIILMLKYESFGKTTLQSLSNISLEIKDWFYGQIKEKEIYFAQRQQELSSALHSKNALLDEASRQSEELRTAFISYRNEKEQKIKALDTEIERITSELLSKDATIIGLNQKSAALNQEISGLNQANESLSQQYKVLNQNFEAKRRDLAEAQSSLKKKDDLIWETYAKSQKLENDYRQSLQTMEDIKSSFSYRVGWLVTSPLRFIYDLLTKKPINQTKLWLGWQFILAGIKMPGKMLANINARNINTLRKALKNESPRQIATNLMKLLTGTSGSEERYNQPLQVSVPKERSTELQISVANHFIQEKQKGQAGKNDKPLTVNVSTRKTVLFTSPFLPDFDGSSGGKRATRMLGLLAEECDVYAFTLGSKPEKHIRKLESLGVRVFRNEDFQEVKKLLPRVDTLIFSFFYMYFDCGKFLLLYPNAQVIVDSVDVHWVRHERSRGLWPELTDDIILKKKALEIDVYGKADIVWTVTEQDRQAVHEEVPDADVRIISNVHSPIVREFRDPGNNNLLFMGGFSHYPNIIAVKKLALVLFPEIRKQVPDARLVIAGSNAPQDIVDLGKLPGVEFLGFIEDGSLDDLYRNSLLAFAPLQTGAGIKGKICEAISYMVPVVTNSIGNEGIGLINEKSGLISDDEKELVKLTVKALRREYDLGEIARNAQSKLYDLVGPDIVKRNMLTSISSPEISICIVTWNKLKLLQRCIESIENHTQGIRYRILVYSNGCNDGTREYLTAAAKINPNIVPILSDTNDVFVIPNNRMMQLFPENDVVLLNNDTYVTDGWLEALRDAAYSSPDIGITGSKLLYPDGRLQEFGSELYADGTGRNIGKFDDPDKKEYLQPRFSGYVSGCAFYIKRSTIKQIGTFDEDFHPCYCEDSDYCYTAWENGIATMVTPDSIVYHDEGGTSGTDVNSGFKAYQKVNFEKFLRKHGERLEETASRIKLKNLEYSFNNQPIIDWIKEMEDSVVLPQIKQTTDKTISMVNIDKIVNSQIPIADKIVASINDISTALEPLNYHSLSTSEFEKVNAAFQLLTKAIKKISYKPGDRKNMYDFEKMGGAQSIQFMVDMLPDIHQVLLKYFNRCDELEVVDIGAGNGAGTNLIAQLHVDRMIYSKMNVSAIDHIDSRLRWVQSQYPTVRYNVAKLADLPSKHWDLVLCSHCLEHVLEHEQFVQDLMRICKGFLFIYTPYDEKNLMHGHLHRFTESYYKDLTIESLRIFNSMAWHPDNPEEKVMLVSIDCRDLRNI